MNRAVRVSVVGVVALLAALVLHTAGSGALATPSAGSWASLEEWYERHGATVAIVSIVRLAGLITSAWVCVACALQLIALLVRTRRLTSIADRLSPRFIRAVVHGAAGLSMTAGLAVIPLPSAAADNPPGTAVMVPLDTTATTPSSVDTTERPEPASTTTTQPPPRIPPTADVPPPPTEEVLVHQGDSFWSVAADHVGDRELVTYWRALIAANHDRLVDRSNPDLLYPNQVLVLP